MSSGWAKQFLRVAERFDSVEAALWPPRTRLRALQRLLSCLQAAISGVHSISPAIGRALALAFGCCYGHRHSCNPSRGAQKWIGSRMNSLTTSCLARV